MSQKTEKAIPPFKTYTFFNKTVYDLGEDIMIYADQYKEYAPRVHIRKFQLSSDQKRIYPSTESVYIDIKNLDFIYEILDSRFKKDFLEIKKYLQEDHETLVEVAKKRKLEEI